MKDLENLTDSEKINYLVSKTEKLEKIIIKIEGKVEAIDATINPPLWKKCVYWFLHNFWTLLFLSVIGYLLWQVWEVVQILQDQFNQVELKITGVKDSIDSQLEKFSEKLEILKHIDFEKLKFWKK